MRNFIPLLLILAACAPQHEPEKKTMLIIGDSISIGYTPTIQNLKYDYIVEHNMGNAMNSRNGVAKIDEWLAYRKHWDIITFNHGFWDLTPDDGTGRYFTDENEYRENLRTIAKKIKLKTDYPVFILITNKPTTEIDFTDAQVQIRNAIARDVMRDENIAVIDLYSFSWGSEINALHLSPKDIHFNEDGYRKLGEFIVRNL